MQPADALDPVKIAREWVNKAMAVSHPMTCAGITSRGPVQANGMCKHFLNAAKCDCPPENSAEARLDAYRDALLAAERARLRGLVEGMRVPNLCKPSGHDSGDWTEYARDLGWNDALDTILTHLGAPK